MTPTPIPRTRPDRETWKHFVRAIRNFLTSEVRARAIFLCGALLLIFLAINAPERGEQLRRARLHDGAREPRSQPLPPGGAALRRGVRRFDGGGGPGELHAGAPRPALAQLAHPTAGRHLSHRPLLRPPAGAGRPAQSRPAHLRGHPDVRHHDPVREPDAAERLDHRRGVLGRPLDDQPDAVPRRHRLRGDRLGRHDPARPPARTPQLPAGRPRGGLSRPAHPRTRERRVDRAAAPRAAAYDTALRADLRPDRQSAAHHQRQPERRVLHHRVQLPHPDHPGADRGAAVHARRRAVRHGDAGGHGVLDPARRVLAGRDAVPDDLLVRRRHGPA